MNNNFNLKSFLAEGRLLNEIQVNKPNEGLWKNWKLGYAEDNLFFIHPYNNKRPWIDGRVRGDIAIVDAQANDPIAEKFLQDLGKQLGTTPQPGPYNNIELKIKEKDLRKVFNLKEYPLDEIQINTPPKRKLKIEVKPSSNNPEEVYFTFNLNDDEISLFSSDLSKDYVDVYLNEDDIYSDRLHEDVINYLNKDSIPFTIHDLDYDTTIDGDEFEIPEDPEEMFNKEISINKKDCLVPKEYQEKFKDL